MVAKRAKPAKKRRVRKRIAKKRTAAKKRVVYKKKPSAAKKRSTKKPSAKKRTTTKKLVKRPTKKQGRVEAIKLQRKLDALRRRTERKRDTPAEEQEREKARREAKGLARKREKKRLEEYGAPPVKPARRMRGKDLRSRFKPLFDIARQTKQLPKADARKRKVDTKRTRGEQRVVKVDDFLDVQNILYQVKHAIKGMSGKFSNWLAAVIFSSLSDSELHGSNMRILVADDPDASSFQTQGVENTGAHRTFEGMIDKLEEELDSLVDVRSLVYVHFVRVMNFDNKGSG